MNKKIIAKGLIKPPKRNALESSYESHLRLRQYAGEVLWWAFEGIRLRLADGTFYTPDFAVMTSNFELQIHETKGFMREAARVRLNVAADKYPFRFFLVKAIPKREGGGFLVTEV